jgi:hypothetical protein
VRYRKALKIWQGVRFSLEQPVGRQIAVTYDIPDRCRDELDGRPEQPLTAYASLKPCIEPGISTSEKTTVMSRRASSRRIASSALVGYLHR